MDTKLISVHVYRTYLRPYKIHWTNLRWLLQVGEAYSILSDEKKRRMYDSGQDLDDGAGHGYQDVDPSSIFQVNYISLTVLNFNFFNTEF